MGDVRDTADNDNQVKNIDAGERLLTVNDWWRALEYVGQDIDSAIAQKALDDQP